jgi:hypothetical protein
MGFTHKVHVMLDPEDGERLEAAFHQHAKFTDLTLSHGVVRTCTISGVEYRWQMRPSA